MRGLLKRWVSSPQEIAQQEVERFATAFAATDYDTAYKALVTALRADPFTAWNRVMDSYGYAAVSVVDRVGRLAEFVAVLEQSYARDPSMIVLCPPGRPEVHADMVARRERYIAEGGRPYYLYISQGKSGTVAIGNLISQGFELMGATYAFAQSAVVPSWARDFARGGASYATHLVPSIDNIQRLRDAGLTRMVLNTRDLRQIFISSLHHFDRYRDDFPELVQRGFFELPFEERVLQSLDIFAEKVAWLKGWKEAQGFDMLVATFEEFVRDKEALLDKLLAFYGGDIRYFNRAAALAQNEGVDYHFRRGEIEEWRRVLPKAVIERMNQQIPDAWFSEFGWKP